MGDDDFEGLNITLPSQEQWDMTFGTPSGTQDPIFTINSPEVFTRYPDLDSITVQQGLGVDVVSGLRKIINESK